MNLRFIPKHFHLPLGLVFAGLVVMISSGWLSKHVRPTQVSAQEAESSQPENNANEAEPLATDVQGDAAGSVLQKAAVNVAEEPLDPGTAFLEPFLYDLREGRRNPFKPPPDIEMSLGGGLAGPTGPLERFELDELKIIAIMWDVKKPRVMIIDPNSEVHTAYKDERIGRRRGYIAVIRENEVVVVEPANYSGETVYSTRILRITE